MQPKLKNSNHIFYYTFNVYCILYWQQIKIHYTPKIRRLLTNVLLCLAREISVGSCTPAGLGAHQRSLRFLIESFAKL